ncbi:carbohydrate ABC transporter permease [Paenibacillus tyrfis]|uniref:Glycerol-3-phosphate ABC transporter permease n=1 Tax=Paenibacillus tyrfis TaxID=1501230 RepID=A0A081P3C4_9BACL|nr:sugar ABC transporter permease [Paenibacillus tyrfis]KEQ25197.1 glycerol-3-phosphate ABC transporter permease [Paenibacillus tyrfis]
MNPDASYASKPTYKEAARKQTGSKIGRMLKPYLFILPCIVLVLLFNYYPFVKTMVLGFTLVDMLGNPVEFVGLENFVEAFQDERLLRALLNTLQFTILTVPATLLITLILALLAEKARKGSRIYQVMFALPMAVSMSSAVMIFQLLMNPTIGMFNYITGLGLNWFGDEKYALTGIAIISVWMSIGFSFLFLLAALRNVPQELLESAEMEGSSYIQKLIRIKLPLISPTLFFLLCTDLIGSLLVFGPVSILTKGGPLGATETMVYWMYTEAFEKGKYGYGSAIAVIIFFIVMIFTLITFAYEKKGVHYT